MNRSGRPDPVPVFCQRPVRSGGNGASRWCHPRERSVRASERVGLSAAASWARAASIGPGTMELRERRSGSLQFPPVAAWFVHQPDWRGCLGENFPVGGCFVRSYPARRFPARRFPVQGCPLNRQRMRPDWHWREVLREKPNPERGWAAFVHRPSSGESLRTRGSRGDLPPSAVPESGRRLESQNCARREATGLRPYAAAGCQVGRIQQTRRRRSKSRRWQSVAWQNLPPCRHLRSTRRTGESFPPATANRAPGSGRECGRGGDRRESRQPIQYLLDESSRGHSSPDEDTAGRRMTAGSRARLPSGIASTTGFQVTPVRYAIDQVAQAAQSTQLHQ